MIEPNKTLKPWDSADYIQKRLDQQQQHLDIAANKKRSIYIFLRSAEIIIAASIPVLALLGTVSEPDLSQTSRLATAIAGALIVVVAGLLGLGKHQQQWLHYRAVSEALKAEKIKFLTRYDDYSNQHNRTDQQRLTRLVDKVESLLGNERHQWLVLQQRADKSSNTKGVEHEQSTAV